MVVTWGLELGEATKNIKWVVCAILDDEWLVGLDSILEWMITGEKFDVHEGIKDPIVAKTLFKKQQLLYRISSLFLEWEKEDEILSGDTPDNQRNCMVGLEQGKSNTMEQYETNQLAIAIHSESSIYKLNDNSSGLCSENDYSGVSQRSKNNESLQGVKIELMDTDLFWAPSAFSHPSKNLSNNPTTTNNGGLQLSKVNEDHDIDQLEDMRDRGHLFYKLDTDSHEYEELNFNFHRRKPKKQSTRDNVNKKSGKDNKKQGESKLELTTNKSKLFGFKHELTNEENFNAQNSSNLVPTDFWSCEEQALERKKKLMSFKEITDAYMRPFCLDIFISKSSVCACIVHRVTSKVVVVAQSISKDMKNELLSTKDLTACAAVGGLLAQRALADDIYTAVYTPRKGEKIEGKLMVVLQSLVDHGLDIKVRLKQRRHRNCTYMGASEMVLDSS
ncbi:uncharacterized protein LOC131060359 [Cryptomeria japonica]|uniref:uncharacterized protein LOC131060359 n=1 Tax=Cryptomeria japonica TaxID=3369 RepID=UPI0025AB792B|nr:uncharacterized protein LOC131060359 [Cryptomeria japonica]